MNAYAKMGGFSAGFVPALILALSLAASLAGCGEGTKAASAEERKPAMAKVEIVEAVTMPWRETIELPGRIAASRVAEVRARAAGVVLSRDFKEGSYVEKGQPLFHIDPAPFLAALAQAKAELAKSQASMTDLEATATRYSKLITTGAISPQDHDTAVNNAKAAVAARDAAVAAVETAELNLGYATVTAPISGRIGKALVTEGALVGQGEATHLATIQQLDPVYADISQPAAEYLKLKSAMNAALSGKDKAEASATLENVDYQVTGGKLLFSDVTVDQDTGQVSLRCEFANPDRMLLPGMYVRIRISLGEEKQAVFAPQRAVVRNADGSATVYVVGKDGTAEARTVVTGRMEGSLWRIVDGLAPGERIVAAGADKVKPGMAVAAVTPPAAPAPAASGSGESAPKAGAMRASAGE